MPSPFKYFNRSPEVIRLAVMLYVRYPLSLRNVEDLLAERGIDICHETVRLWWNRFGPLFAAEVRKRRLRLRQGCPEWRWHLDEVFVKINGQIHYLWRAVDHEGEVLEHVRVYLSRAGFRLGLKCDSSFWLDWRPVADATTLLSGPASPRCFTG
jgi:transposase-like protein